MLATLEVVKSVLGIAEDDISHDAQLTRLIVAATTTIERATNRRFDTPIPRVEYRCGTNDTSIILAGHIDDTGDNPSEMIAELQVARRSLPRLGNEAWEPMVEGTDYERREDEILALGTWGLWVSSEEYRFTYPDGYLVAPADLQEVLFEIVTNRRAIEGNVVGGTAGISSESLGDFRYGVDFNVVGAGGSTTLSDSSMQTLKRYRRVLV